MFAFDARMFEGRQSRKGGKKKGAAPECEGVRKAKGTACRRLLSVGLC